MLELCTAALFTQAPAIGDVNPPGEVSYVGYGRVPLIAMDGTNATEIHFPEVDQDEPVFVSHVVALDGCGRVVGVRALG